MKSIFKLFLLLVSSMFFLSSLALAAPPEHAKANKDKKEKYKDFKDYDNDEYSPRKDKKLKQKHLPYGLQKKLQRTGQLPPGWQKKIRAGEVVSNSVLENGVILRPPYWDTHPYSKNSDIYEVQDKIFRVNRATKEILDVFK